MFEDSDRIARAVVWIVSVTGNVLLPGTTVEGEKFALAPVGRPAMLIVTAPEKGAGCAEIKTAYVATVPPGML